ncbi:helix-turn-helix domain-containing protein [Paenibacillus sp. YYML68]|uniref:helix-turn-helix domain-containing protein n=1 Tax=Paenibacillus sp. YYML68 TaxID=2909250 RepID=UPI0024910954|nr:helix-turn-helix domain-containing protein [Paenibacillus sp. YYML68]
MSESDLYDLVHRAQNGDKEALGTILHLFRPVILKASKKAKPQERRDLEQHMSEKIIRAVYAYDMDSIPNYSQFVKEISDAGEA